MKVKVFKNGGLFWEGFDWSISELVNLDKLAWVAAKFALILESNYTHSEYTVKLEGLYE